MKIWVLKKPRKTSYVWIVRAYDPITKKTKDLETFPKNRKTQAEAFATEKHYLRGCMIDNGRFVGKAASDARCRPVSGIRRHKVCW